MQNILEVITRDNLLGGIALEAYEILYHNPDLTTGEIWRRYKARNPRQPRSRNEIAKRVRDLEVWGAIDRSGNRACEVTGRVVNTYRITGAAPDKTIKAAPTASPNLFLGKPNANTIMSQSATPSEAVQKMEFDLAAITQIRKTFEVRNAENIRLTLLAQRDAIEVKMGKWWVRWFKSRRQKLEADRRLLSETIHLLAVVESEIELPEALS